MTWAATGTSEDCLYLNVYAPEGGPDTGGIEGESGGGFPVVVYYPSGAFEWGAANDVESNAFGKAETPGWKSSVLVTVNCRTCPSLLPTVCHCATATVK